MERGERENAIDAQREDSGERERDKTGEGARGGGIRSMSRRRTSFRAAGRQERSVTVVVARPRYRN